MFQDFLYKHPVGASALRTGRMRTFCPLLEPQLHLPCSPSAALVLNPLAEEANHQNHQMATTVGHRGPPWGDRDGSGDLRFWASEHGGPRKGSLVGFEGQMVEIQFNW